MPNSEVTAVVKAAAIFKVAKKVTVLRLRWLVVIICSYLLLSSSETWLPSSLVHAFIFVYVVTNLALYYINDSYFESSSFYSPLLIFDTLMITASLVISGEVATDFYLIYFLIVILCSIWEDFIRLIIVSALATLLYGYFLFQTTTIPDPSVYLRIPFLFVISLFYGYFVQVVRVEKELKEQAEQEAHDMAMVQTLSQALPSALDYNQILETVRGKIGEVVRAAKISILLLQGGPDASKAAVYEAGDNGSLTSSDVELRQYPIVEECMAKRRPIIQQSVAAVFGGGQPAAGDGFSFPVLAVVPVAFRQELHGAILLGFNEADRALSSREMQFCQIVAFATAIALSHAKKYDELQTEAKRRQIIANELAEANRLKSEFLANTTHELRTPIAAVVGYGDLLVQGVFGSLTDRQKETLTRLTENARAMLRLVEEILDYSKLERGETSLFIKEQEVLTFIEDLRREFAPLEQGKNYQVQYVVEEGLPSIRTDWGKLKRILMNFLSNALKFTEHGSVKLSVACRSRGEVAFSVSDTGIGIPPDRLPLIFDKFRQLDGSTSRRYSGTGLGLTIAKNLADLIGGKLEVLSEPGKGSTFAVVIPVAESAAAVTSGLGGGASERNVRSG